jgi:hypothetical protein
MHSAALPTTSETHGVLLSVASEGTDGRASDTVLHSQTRGFLGCPHGHHVDGEVRGDSRTTLILLHHPLVPALLSTFCATARKMAGGLEPTAEPTVARSSGRLPSKTLILIHPLATHCLSSLTHSVHTMIDIDIKDDDGTRNAHYVGKLNFDEGALEDEKVSAPLPTSVVYLRSLPSLSL